MNDAIQRFRRRIRAIEKKWKGAPETRAKRAALVERDQIKARMRKAKGKR